MPNNEITLNGTKFRLAGDGMIKPVLVSQFPQRIVIGEPDKASNPLVSSLVISDQRGGVGILDADSPDDMRRCWFSTSELAYKNSISLPRLVTEVTAIPRTVVNPTSTTSSPGWTNPNNSWDNNQATLASVPGGGAPGWSDYLTLGTPTATIAGVAAVGSVSTFSNDQQIEISA